MSKVNEVKQHEKQELWYSWLFEILKSRRGRLVLEFLQDQGQSTVGDITMHVASQELNKEIDEVTSTERKRVYVSIYQTHLPKMEDMDLIRFDKEDETVEKGEMFHVITRYLEKGLFLESRMESDEVDHLFVMVKSFRRRFTVRYLEENGTVALTDLAKACASKETGDDLQELKEEDKKKVYDSFNEYYLPDLVDAGIVGWDKTTGEVWPEDMQNELFLLDKPRFGIQLRWRLWKARRTLSRNLPS